MLNLYQEFKAGEGWGVDIFTEGPSVRLWREGRTWDVLAVYFLDGIWVFRDRRDIFVPATAERIRSYFKVDYPRISWKEAR